MPLGNLTSQFFANVYLNELDQFVKHELKAKYYVRYVDDFVIVHPFWSYLKTSKDKVELFLKSKLGLQLHPEKSKIILAKRGTDFLGQRIFDNHTLLRKKNLRKFRKKLHDYCQEYKEGIIGYDHIYDFLEGWCAHSKNANTYKLRKKVLEHFEQEFNQEISTKEVNRGLK